MIHAADQNIEGSALNERLLLPWTDAPQLVFYGIQGLLSDQTPPERRARALDRLKAYVGMAPGTTPIAELAKARYTERAGDTALLRPTKLEVEQALGNVDTYVDGIRKLFAKYKIEGAEPALDAMATQLKDYAGVGARHGAAGSARRREAAAGAVCVPAQAVRHRHRSAAADRPRRGRVHGNPRGDAAARAAGGEGEGPDRHRRQRLHRGDPRAEEGHDPQRPARGALPQGDRRDRPDHPQARHRRRAEAADGDAPGQRGRIRGAAGAAFPAGAAGRQHRAAGAVRAAGGGAQSRTARRCSTTTSISNPRRGRCRRTRAVPATNCSSPRWSSAASRWRARCSRSTRSTSRAGRCTPRPRWCRTNRSTGR